MTMRNWTPICYNIVAYSLRPRMHRKLFSELLNNHFVEKKKKLTGVQHILELILSLA